MVDTYKKVSSRVEADWYPYHREEWFTHDDICRFFDWRDQETKQAASRKLYHDYHEQKIPVLEKNGKTYKLIDYEANEIDWQAADHTKTLDIALPFGIEKYIKLFPKNLIVVAGASNAGKTAWLYNFIILNMNKHIITLYNSETGPEQMKERFLNFEEPVAHPAPFITKERYADFADIIDPDGISVIDYLDYDSEVYQIGIELGRIFKKIRKLAVVAIQKKRNTKNFQGKEVKYELGYGSDTTLKRASLYITMDSNRLKIIKAKSWRNPQINPNGMTWTFKLVQGCRFVNIQREDEPI